MIANKLPGRLFLALASVFSMLFASSAQAELQLNMTQSVTQLGRDLYGLHMLVFWICVVIGVVVFGAMTWSIIHHRKSKGATAANFHESTTVEVVWTIVPLVILVAIAIPATGTLLELEDTSNSDITLKVTGIQWKWKYEYIGEDVSFISSLAQLLRNDRRAYTSLFDPCLSRPESKDKEKNIH